MEGCTLAAVAAYVFNLLTPLELWLICRPVCRELKRLAEDAIVEWLSANNCCLLYTIYMSPVFYRWQHERHVRTQMKSGRCMIGLKFKRYDTHTGLFEFERQYDDCTAVELSSREWRSVENGRHSQLLVTCSLWAYRELLSAMESHQDTIKPIAQLKDLKSGREILTTSETLEPSTPPQQIHSPTRELFGDNHPDRIHNGYDQILNAPRKRHLPECKCCRHYYCDTQERINDYRMPLRAISFSFKSISSMQEELMIYYHCFSASNTICHLPSPPPSAIKSTSNSNGITMERPTKIPRLSSAYSNDSPPQTPPSVSHVKQSETTMRFQLDKLVCSPSFLFAPMLVVYTKAAIRNNESGSNEPTSIRRNWNEMFDLSEIEESSEVLAEDDEFWEGGADTSKETLVSITRYPIRQLDPTPTFLFHRQSNDQ